MANKSRLEYHLVLVTKHHKPVLTPEIMKTSINAISNALKNLNVDVIEIKGDQQNHIHALISLKPSQSISVVVRYAKQMSTWQSWKEHGPLLRKDYWYKNVLWSRGYFCESVGVDNERIIQYIKNQESKIHPQA